MTDENSTESQGARPRSRWHTLATRTDVVARFREAIATHADVGTASLAISGELLVARVRLLLVGLLLAMQVLPGSDPDTRRVTLPLTGVALVVAALFYYLASRRPRPWLQGFASSAVDVTLVSCGLATFLVLDQPQMALNTHTLFELYFIVIACAGLRYNPQACAMTGLLALTQYGALVVYCASRWSHADARFATFREGALDLNAQGARLILLAAAALISAIIVLRAQGLREISHTDRLTGLANRRAFDDRVALEADRARRYGRPFAVAIIDVDHFKRVNDTFGHAQGDLALRTVAGVFERAHRATDVAARVGGDEFALLLPETTAELVMPRLEALRRQIGDTPIPLAADVADGPQRVTISIGVANWPDDGEAPETVLATADARLYEAKRLGRDCSVGPPAVWEALSMTDVIPRRGK